MAKKNNIDVLQRLGTEQRFTEAEISGSLVPPLRKDYTRGKVVKAAVSPSVQIQRITTCAGYLVFQAEMEISRTRATDPRIRSIEGAKNRAVGWLREALPTNRSSGTRKDSLLTREQNYFLVALLLEEIEGLDQEPGCHAWISRRDRFAMLLMLLCGLRIGELLNLKVEDIQFGSITSLHTKRRPIDPDDPRSIRPLVKRRERTLNVDQGLAGIINNYILYERENALEVSEHDTEYLIVSRKGSPLSLSRMGKICKALARRFPARLPKGFSAHSLRHAFSVNIERDLRDAGYEEDRLAIDEWPQ